MLKEGYLGDYHHTSAVTAELFYLASTVMLLMLEFLYLHMFAFQDFICYVVIGILDILIFAKYLSYTTPLLYKIGL